MTNRPGYQPPSLEREDANDISILNMETEDLAATMRGLVMKQARADARLAELIEKYEAQSEEILKRQSPGL